MTPFSRNQSMQFIVLMQRTESSMWSETRARGAKIRVARSLTSGRNSMHRQCFASTYPSCLVDLLGNVSTSVSIIIRLLSNIVLPHLLHRLHRCERYIYDSLHQHQRETSSFPFPFIVGAIHYSGGVALVGQFRITWHQIRRNQRAFRLCPFFTDNQFPAFFWKLHVSLPPRDYERHIQSIVDFLVMRKVDFKLPDMTFPQILFNSNWNRAYNI